MSGCSRKIGPFDCCTVVLGDCAKEIKKIPAGSIDLVVTDPPYGMNLSPFQKHQRRIHGDDHFPADTIKRLVEIPRLAAYFFCRWDNLWEHGSLPRPKSVLVWEKGNGVPVDQHAHCRDYEMALFFPGPEHKFKGRPGDILASYREGNDLHPTTKPPRLIRQMLSWYKFEVVLDPYAGIGTTGQAVKAMGKHFLGFEIDKEYQRTANELIWREVPKPPKGKRGWHTPPFDFYS